MCICYVYLGLTRVQPRKGRSSCRREPAAEEKESSHGREGVQPRKGRSLATEGEESSRERKGVHLRKGKESSRGRERV
ncbi:hypothetical protein Tco_0517524 [Tanacetum coccineum]